MSGCQREKAGKVEVADFLTVEEVTPDGGKEEKGERRGRKGQNEEEADAGRECIKMVKNYEFIPKQPGVN